MAHTRGALSSYSLHCFEWGSIMLLRKLSSSHSINMMGHKAFEAQQSHPIPFSSLHVMDGLSLPDLVPPSDKVDSESVMGVKPDDSSVVIGFWVDEFTHT